jgi:hypothetical protein
MNIAFSLSLESLRTIAWFAMIGSASILLWLVVAGLFTRGLGLIASELAAVCEDNQLASGLPLIQSASRTIRVYKILGTARMHVDEWKAISDALQELPKASSRAADHLELHILSEHIGREVQAHFENVDTKDRLRVIDEIQGLVHPSNQK